MQHFVLSLTVLFAPFQAAGFPVQATDQGDVPRFTISTVAGTGERGNTMDDGPALEADIQRPTAVALDSEDNLYIADEANHVVRMVRDDGWMTIVVGTGDNSVPRMEDLAVLTNVSNAYGIATDHHDNLFVLSRGHNRIYKVGEDRIARVIVGNGGRGFGGDGGPALQAQINYSNHLVADGEGNLFIADSGNNRIRKVDLEGIITTIAGTGVMGFSGDGGPATEAQMAVPAAIAIDELGSLYVADFRNHRIRKISKEGIITTIAGTGVSGYNGDGGAALQSQIGEPCGVVVDSNGLVYIADQVNLRVRVVTLDGRMETIAGTGIRGSEGDGGPAEKAQISNPDIIALDRHGNLYLPDHANCLVRKLTRVP